MANILVIDSDESFYRTVAPHVIRMGHTVTYSPSMHSGIMNMQTGTYEIVFLNDRLPDGTGMDIVPEIVENPFHPEVIVIADSSDPDTAARAIASGAWDYISRRSSLRDIVRHIVHALQYHSRKIVREPSLTLKKETYEGIVGRSPRMRAALDLLAQAARSDLNVLIAGETGTGKEIFAWAIHNNSTRADRNFVVVDCTALPETLVESTLFGYERGAYTGAERSQTGLIKQADGGTLFLDEVGELPTEVQKSFLRVLQEKNFRTLGGKEEIRSDFRLIAATNRNLDTMARQKRFRKDLLFRLRALTIELPPLREHPEDIEDLVSYHLAELCKRHGVEKKGVSPSFLQVLTRYRWPGNVRELFHALERAMAVSQGEPMLFPKHLPTYLRINVAKDSIDKKREAKTAEEADSPETTEPPPLQQFRDDAVARAEQKYLRNLLDRTGGDIKEACRISGLSRSRLYGLIKKHGLTRPIQ
jgi:two-component system NtrC family response regulator